MSLAQAICDEIASVIQGQLQNLGSSTAELRTVFNGPPEPFMAEVYKLLAEGGGLQARLGYGGDVKVPVLLLQEQNGLISSNPPIGVSGYCDKNHILNLRNAPSCPRFIVLSGPGHQSSLSHDTTWFYCGLSPQHQAANTPIDDWIQDEFIQRLITNGALRLKSSQQDWEQDVSLLAATAIRAADAADEANGQRQLSWTTLDRLYSLRSSDESAARSVSLALGFPPLADLTISASQQIRVIQKLADLLEDGFGPTVAALKEQAEDDGERLALENFLVYLVARCSTSTAVTQSMAYFYAPFVGTTIYEAPAWWAKLTLERWQSLLVQSSASSESLEVKALNSLNAAFSGAPTIVRGRVSLEIGLPGNRANEINIFQITRDSGSRLTRRTWTQAISGQGIWEDPDPPPHKRALKYTVASGNFKPTSIHVVSIENFSPGLMVLGRDARKSSAPKPPRPGSPGVALETSLTLRSEGRQYLNVFVKPGIKLDSKAVGVDTDGEKDEAAISEISDVEFGVEIKASADKIYDLDFTKEGGTRAERLRIVISCDDVDADFCGSEFERLVLLNCSRARQASSATVHVNGALRSSDLQSWILGQPTTYYPLVFGPDYASCWRPRNFGSPEDTIISAARFLSDPRPPFSEMLPPPAFVEARQEIAKRIVLWTESGLLEEAPLAVWLSNPGDPFGGWLEDYLRAYTDWLAHSPKVATWCDLAIVTGFAGDRRTLAIEPHAVLISPLHPLRLCWQASAQQVLWDTYQKKPCPAASILDPNCVPDCLTLPIYRASGDIGETVFFSLECSSDYWSVLRNSRRGDLLADLAEKVPFDAEFGITIGGLASSFSVSQVNRSMNDISSLLSSKPVFDVAITSSNTKNDSTNIGVMEWSRGRFSKFDRQDGLPNSLGRTYLRVLDHRPDDHRPTEADISNLTEDTNNSVSWYKVADKSAHNPDLTIVAQLEASNTSSEKSRLSSPLSIGALFRIRIREQLKAGAGAFLSESRVAGIPRLQAEGLLARTAKAVAHFENIGELRHSYVFAPSVHTLRESLETSRYVAVSSSAIDPACFLGGWLDDGTYLWDYDLPSYSTRAGDSNGYYLLAKISPLDRDTLRSIIQRLPEIAKLADEAVDNVILEVARRGIPTVRGLSGGDSGAIGELGLFVAARLLQDEFRIVDSPGSLFEVWQETEASCNINLLIPIDPFQGYIDEISRILAVPSHRPDLLLLSLHIQGDKVRGKFVPIEVKFRSDRMPSAECTSALAQARSFAVLMKTLRVVGDNSDLVLWKLAYTHFQLVLVDYAFRVYSQQRSVMFRGAEWAQRQTTVMHQIIEDGAILDCDLRGRLIVIDGSSESKPKDIDGDGFFETINLSQSAAAEIIAGDPHALYASISQMLGGWGTSADAQLTPRGSVPPGSAGKVSEVEHDPVAGAPAVNVASETSTESPADPKGAATPRSSGEQKEPSAPGIVIQVGYPLDTFDPKLKTLNICDTNLNQMNVGVVGDLGTGKTQLLKSLVYQITQQGKQNNGVKPNILILDYKRDYSAADFVKATGARVVRPHNLNLNLFDLSQAAESMTPWIDRFNFFADVLDKVYSGIGPVQRSTLKAAVRSVYQGRSNSNPPTIYDVHAAYRAATNGRPDSVSSIIEDMVDRELFCADAAQASTKDFLNGTVVISLDALGQADQAKNLVVAIMLNLFYDNMLRIEKRPFYGQNPQRRVIDSFLLVDEADNIMQYEFEVLRKILLQGREFGVGAILASQYLSHFKARATDYREMLLTWLVHKVPNVSPTELNALGMIGNQSQTAERIKTLSLHQCLFKTFDVGGEFEMGIPFYKIIQPS